MKLPYFALFLGAATALSACVDDPAAVTTEPAAKAWCSSDVGPVNGQTLPAWQAWNGVLPPDVANATNSWVMWPLTGQETGYFKLYQVNLTNKTVVSVRRLSTAQRPAVMAALGGRSGALMVIRVPPPVGPGGDDWSQLKSVLPLADVANGAPF